MTSEAIRTGARDFTNGDVADVLEEVAALLEVQDANPFRVRAYREAAGTIRALPTPVRSIVAERGLEGLEALPGIGTSLAGAVRDLITSGRLGLLDRLKGRSSPEDIFRTVPGIGPELAHRIHTELDVDTLEELEIAAHDGRLETIRGFGPRRVRGVRASLAGLLGGASRRRAVGGPGRDLVGSEEGAHVVGERPSVATLLSVDQEYRDRAHSGDLPLIAPLRFNPSGRPWLPILHTERLPWHFTALYSNTARAHQLGRTHDWVLIYADGVQGGERGFTVVTEYRGGLSGKRVVRGREAECRSHYGSA
jgi:hypothetical protein